MMKIASCKPLKPIPPNDINPFHLEKDDVKITKVLFTMKKLYFTFVIKNTENINERIILNGFQTSIYFS